MISPMRHMGNSGKTAIGAFAAAAGLLVLTSVTLEEAVLVAFLGAVAVGYVASLAEAFARHRYLALLAGGAGTSLFIGCSIAFLRTWGLAFNQDAAALGQAVTTRDSDIYFYLAAASGCLTLLVLFCAAVWPPRRRLQRNAASNGGRAAESGNRAAGTPARPAARLPAGARQPAQQKRPVQRTPVQRTPVPRTPAQRSDGRTSRR